MEINKWKLNKWKSQKEKIAINISPRINKFLESSIFLN